MVPSVGPAGGVGGEEVVCAGVFGGDSGVVGDLRRELAILRREFADVVEENERLRDTVRVLSGGDAGDGDGKWSFVTSRRGRKVKETRRGHSPAVPVGNVFDILEDECNGGKADDISQPSSKSVKVLGDSLCRGLGRQMRSKVSGTFCYPGAGVGQIVERVGGLVDGDTVACLIVGGNDVHKRRSEELVGLYKEALERVRRNGGIAVACGILPRMGHSREWCSRAIGFNRRIEEFCHENRLVFVDVWDRFYGCREMYARDGIHLSATGAAQLGSLVDDAVGGFC